MSDIKLFRLGSSGITELDSTSIQVEKSLQKIFEANLETLLGIRFLASEYSTGPVHGGRIDTLGLDEDNCPIIIEYKRAINDNVINQGLFYLDWLFDHRKDFQWFVLEKLGSKVANDIDWSAPRLICIAGDFTRYDEHAVKQIARNIELIRYHRFEDELLMLELVHAPKVAKVAPVSIPQGEKTPIAASSGDPYLSQRIDYRLSQADQKLRDVFDAARQFLIGLGDDVQEKQLKNYIAFKRIKNFVCLEIYPQTKVVMAYLKADPLTVKLEDGFSRDVTEIGHFGTGNLELTIRSMDDFVRAQPLFQRSYDGS